VARKEGRLYKLGADGVIRRCIPDHERTDILWECHSRVAGGHTNGKRTACNILQARLWWPAMFPNAKEYTKSCDVCQIIGRPSCRDKMSIHLVLAPQPFYKWAVDFIGPINPLAQYSREQYTITATNYL